MRPYHILLAVRIIILYQSILLFCVHRGLLFFLVLLFAISETSPTYSTRFVPFTFLLSTSLSRPRIFLVLLVVLRVQVSCCPILRLSLSLSVYLPLRSYKHQLSNSAAYSISSPYGSWVFPRTGGAFFQFFLPPCTLRSSLGPVLVSRNVLCRHRPTRRVSDSTHTHAHAHPSPSPMYRTIRFPAPIIFTPPVVSTGCTSVA